MMQFTSKLSLLLLCMALPAPSWANDITTLQYSVTAAEDELSAARTDYGTLGKLVQDQEKRFAQEQARLKDLQQKQAKAKERLDQAQIKVDQEQKALDRAWEKGKK